MRGPALRTASPGDVDFLARVVLLANEDRYAGRPDWDRDAFLLGLVDDAADQVHGGPPDSTTSVIEIDGAPVGRLRLVVAADRIEIAGIQVLPAYQRRGIGTAILRDVLGRAERDRVPVILEVETDNPDARRLYERLGFAAAVTVEGDRRTMTCDPRP